MSIPPDIQPTTTQKLAQKIKSIYNIVIDISFTLQLFLMSQIRSIYHMEHMEGPETFVHHIEPPTDPTVIFTDGLISQLKNKTITYEQALQQINETYNGEKREQAIAALKTGIYYTHQKEPNALPQAVVRHGHNPNPITTAKKPTTTTNKATTATTAKTAETNKVVSANTQLQEAVTATQKELGQLEQEVVETVETLDKDP